MQVPRPINNLAVSIMRLLSAERRPANQTLKHNRTHRPPIAAVVVALAAENLGRNVIRRTDGRVGELATRLTPCVDLGTVADSELDLVEIHGLSVVSVRLVGAACEQLLVVACVVLLVEAGRETEICQLDVAASVEKNVVGFDVTGKIRLVH